MEQELQRSLPAKPPCRSRDLIAYFALISRPNLRGPNNLSGLHSVVVPTEPTLVDRPGSSGGRFPATLT